LNDLCNFNENFRDVAEFPAIFLSIFQKIFPEISKYHTHQENPYQTFFTNMSTQTQPPTMTPLGTNTAANDSQDHFVQNSMATDRDIRALVNLTHIFDPNKELKISIPKLKSITSSIFITIGDKTVRAASRAFLKSGMDVCIYELDENATIPEKCFEQTFKIGTHCKTSIVAIIGMRIGKLQDIKIKGCGPSN
jgi:hypothetical protein